MSDILKKTHKLTCIITGKTLFAINDYYQKKVVKAGSEENLHKTYVCKEAKDLLIKGHTVEEIRKLLGSDLTTEVSEEVLNQIVSLKLKNRIPSKPVIPVHADTEKDVVAFLDNLKQNP